MISEFLFEEDLGNALILYIENSITNEIPIIINLQHFSQLVGIDHNYLLRMVHHSNSFYYQFKITFINLVVENNIKYNIVFIF